MLIKVLKVLFVFNWGVTGYQEHRSLIFDSFNQRGDCVGESGAMGHGCDTKTACCFGPTLGHAYCVGLMSRAHQIYSVLPLKIFSDEEIAVSENPEDCVDSMIYEGLGYCVVS